jgi:predicted 2-oxoglutarate/Fe(II)-dependent dioxygenase YbiX
MPHSQAFSLEQKKYQLFFEITKHDNKSNDKNSINNIMTQSRGLHDYYCTFLNRRIFNTRYINYDPDEHKFKNHVVKNRKQNHNAIGFHLNVNLTKVPNMKKMKNF